MSHFPLSLVPASKTKEVSENTKRESGQKRMTTTIVPLSFLNMLVLACCDQQQKGLTFIRNSPLSAFYVEAAMLA